MNCFKVKVDMTSSYLDSSQPYGFGGPAGSSGGQGFAGSISSSLGKSSTAAASKKVSFR